MISPALIAGGRLGIQLTFVGACLLTIFFIFRRPYLYIRMGRRHVRLKTYFLGALFVTVEALRLYGFIVTPFALAAALAVLAIETVAFRLLMP